MQRNFGLIPVTVILICVCASMSFAQTDYKVGDTIYVNAFNAGCVKATVKQTDPKYYVHIEEGSYKDKETFYNASRIADCPQKTVETQNQLPEKKQPANNQGNMKVGDRVDVYLSGNQEGKNRGTIIDLGDNQVKVRYDGCSEKQDVWENFVLVHPETIISAEDPEIKFFKGKWSMTTVGMSSEAIAWGKSAGIQINSDGTYLWYQDGGKPPVKGKWQAHAKIDGTRFGTEKQNGILISDAKGYTWKIYRRRSTIDNDDHITAQLMCSGETKMGTRVR